MRGNFKRDLLARRGQSSAGWRLWGGWDPFARLRRWFAEEVWRLDETPRGVRARIGRRLARLTYLTLSGFQSDRCMVRAAALTYTTVLSLVPLLAVCFSVLKGLGWYEDFRHGTVKGWLDELAPAAAAGTGELAPGTTAGTDDFAHGLRMGIERVLEMVDQTDVRGLQAIGLVLVIWGVVSLLGTIEAAFNDIWGVHRSRSYLRKATDYLAVVFVAPILIAISGGLAASVNRSVNNVLGVDISSAMALLLRASPLILTWAAFSFVYAALPNTRTWFRSSLLGGLLAALGWHAALALHVEFQLGVARYNAIYSTFAALPIFLVWVQLSWAIVLLGAEVAYAFQHENEFQRIVGWREPSPRELARLVIRVAARLAHTFVSDAPPRTAGDLARELGVPSPPVDAALEVLSACGLAACSEHPDGGRWRVARDPARVSLCDLIDAALSGGASGTGRSIGALDPLIDSQLDQLADERRTSPANLTLRELIERAQSEESERAAAARDGGGAT